jgi:hypothetical protein
MDPLSYRRRFFQRAVIDVFDGLATDDFDDGDIFERDSQCTMGDASIIEFRDTGDTGGSIISMTATVNSAAGAAAAGATRSPLREKEKEHGKSSSGKRHEKDKGLPPQSPKSGGGMSSGKNSPATLAGMGSNTNKHGGGSENLVEGERESSDTFYSDNTSFSQPEMQLKTLSKDSSISGVSNSTGPSSLGIDRRFSVKPLSK